MEKERADRSLDFCLVFIISNMGRSVVLFQLKHLTPDYPGLSAFGPNQDVLHCLQLAGSGFSLVQLLPLHQLSQDILE
jgi:hypothetical protein